MCSCGCSHTIVGRSESAISARRCVREVKDGNLCGSETAAKREARGG